MNLLNKIIITERNKISDSRGWFLKVINGLEANLPLYTGEVYVTSGFADQSRGGHYHNIANEWFTLIKGNCVLKLLDIETGEKSEIYLSEKEPVTVYVPKFVAHSFVNVDKNEFILIAYSDILFDPKDTIPVTF